MTKTGEKSPAIAKYNSNINKQSSSMAKKKNDKEDSKHIHYRAGTELLSSLSLRLPQPDPPPLLFH